MNTIAERLKKAREIAHLTQPDLATRAGVSQGTIGNIESGLRKRPRDLLAIADALGVNPTWLETGKGQMQAVAHSSEASIADMDTWMEHASPRSRAVIDQLKLLAQKNILGDEDWDLIQQLAQRFQQQQKKR